MVLVYGAAGLLGEEICRRLRLQNKRVRALLPRSTSPASLDALRRLNVELFMADLSDLPAVAAACSGEQAVICTDPAMLPGGKGPALEAGGVRCLVEFASTLSVREFVFVTVPERFETACALVSAREECHARLKAHRMNYCVLETGFFMETWISPELGFHHREGKATVFGEGNQPVAWVSCDDVAELAIRCLGVEHRHKRQIQVAAQENVSPVELIRVFEEMRGEKFAVTRIPESDLRVEYQKARDPANRIQAAMKLEYARGFPMRADSDEIPITLRSVKDYARRAASSHAGAMGAN